MLSLESGELLYLVASLYAPRKKFYLLSSFQASRSLQLHHLITSGWQYSGLDRIYIKSIAY